MFWGMLRSHYTRDMAELHAKLAETAYVKSHYDIIFCSYQIKSEQNIVGASPRKPTDFPVPGGSNPDSFRGACSATSFTLFHTHNFSIMMISLGFD